MIRYVPLVVAAMALGLATTTAAAAQTTSQSGSLSGAQAAAITAPTYNFSGNPANTQNRITTTPSMTAPNVFSSNPCVVGASGAVSAMGFGAALGGSIEDVNCTRRAMAALLAQMGQPDAAVEVLCNNDEVRAALASVGRPCVADRPAGTPHIATPVVQPQPQPQRAGTPLPQQVVAASAIQPVARPEWCYTASTAERARAPVCN